MDLEKYVGKPYEEYDCFTLVKGFYKDKFGADLSNYWEGGVVPPRATVECLVVSNLGDFQKVETPIFGDIVVMRFFGYSCHMGVVVGEGKVLHSVRTIGSCIEYLTKYKHIIEGFYRLRKGTDNA